MKTLLLIIASLFAYNENVNYYSSINDMFAFQFANFNVVDKSYDFMYDYTPNSMTEEAFNNFKNGSSNLYFEIPESFKVDTLRTNLFYISVDGEEYNFQQELGGLTELYYEIPNFFASLEYGVVSSIEISVPTTFPKATLNYEYRFESSILYTREALKQQLLGNTYSDGYNQGIADGYEQGNVDGYNLGYAEGLLEGSSENGELNGLFHLLSTGFSSFASILAIQLFPGFTLGLLLFLPVIFGIAYVLLKFLLGGSS